MYVDEVHWMYYFCWHPLGSKLIAVKEDLQYQKTLVEKEQEFYDRLRNFDPPPATDRDYCKREDAIWSALAEEYKYLDAASKEMARQLKECKENLIEAAEGKSSRGAGITLSKSKGRETVDYKSAFEYYAEDCRITDKEMEKFKKLSADSWRITT